MDPKHVEHLKPDLFAKDNLVKELLFVVNSMKPKPHQNARCVRFINVVYN